MAGISGTGVIGVAWKGLPFFTSHRTGEHVHILPFWGIIILGGISAASFFIPFLAPSLLQASYPGVVLCLIISLCQYGRLG